MHPFSKAQQISHISSLCNQITYSLLFLDIMLVSETLSRGTESLLLTIP